MNILVYTDESGISIHKALAGLDPDASPLHTSSTDFNPQGPRGPRQVLIDDVWSGGKFQSTRPSRASTTRPGTYNKSFWHFNPQGPRGPRPVDTQGLVVGGGFQSTRPSRASTTLMTRYRSGANNFNPQGPRGPRRLLPWFFSGFSPISIHKALAGLDLDTVHSNGGLSQFQSTRPSRASTGATGEDFNRLRISIHKALAGLDYLESQTRLRHIEISIHKALAGLDFLPYHESFAGFQFQSTRPSRASTRLPRRPQQP